MKLIIEGEAKEIAELAKEMQTWLNSNKLNISGITDQFSSAIQDALKSICDTTPEFQK